MYYVPDCTIKRRYKPLSVGSAVVIFLTTKKILNRFLGIWLAGISDNVLKDRKVGRLTTTDFFQKDAKKL